jgi:hypothetical protein
MRSYCGRVCITGCKKKPPEIDLPEKNAIWTTSGGLACVLRGLLAMDLRLLDHDLDLSGILDPVTLDSP